MGTFELLIVFAALMAVISLVAIAIDWVGRPLKNRRFIPRIYRYEDEVAPDEAFDAPLAAPVLAGPPVAMGPPVVMTPPQPPISQPPMAPPPASMAPSVRLTGSSSVGSSPRVHRRNESKIGS